MTTIIMILLICGIAVFIVITALMIRLLNSIKELSQSCVTNSNTSVELGNMIMELNTRIIYLENKSLKP